jgi:hypothetical protein
MTRLTIQYLEDARDIAAITPGQITARLRDAFARLPFEALIVGWPVRGALLDACAVEAGRAQAALFRWHLLLVDDGAMSPPEEWRVIGLNGQPVRGFRDLPEFTFICPNKPAVRDAVLVHLEQALARSPYDGVFFDRMRWPSLTGPLAQNLGCFCKDCARAAAAEGLDLHAVRRDVLELVSDRTTLPNTIAALCGHSGQDSGMTLLHAFMRFRANSITRFMTSAAQLARDMGKRVAFDCFAPSLSPWVGQDLAALQPLCDWIKLMTYGHTLAPAGMPYEIARFVAGLSSVTDESEAAVLNRVQEALRLPMPSSIAALRDGGISVAGLAAEVASARALGLDPVLAGIELVDAGEITRLNDAQIAEDLAAMRAAGADGFALSWDLHHISDARLALVAQALG